MRVYAHRGFCGRFPENTLPAFQGALDLGIYGVELDVHLSKDGVPVVIHDETLERTTNGAGLVTDATTTELAALDAGNGQGVPTLEDVVALADGRMHFDIEIKGKNCEEGVLGVLARYPQSKAAISSFDWEVLANVRELSAEIELWVLTPVVSDEAIETAMRLGATTLAVYFPKVNKGSVERARAARLDVMAWTVNSQGEADRWRDLGVVAICTDRPDQVR